MNIIQKKNITIKDFYLLPTTVTYEEIEKVLGKREYIKFEKFMDGQTCSGSGVYIDDLKRYLNQRHKGIDNPSVGD